MGETPGSLWRLAVFGAVAGAAILARQHLLHQFWYDEAYTLDYFATGDFRQAFCDYHAPNNHILFSACLSLWRRFLTWCGASHLFLRFLPYVLFLMTVAWTASVFRRLGGSLAGGMAAVLLASSHVTLNFASELRGYGPSWLPIILSLGAAHNFCQAPGWRPALAYAAAAACAVAIVPTNLLACAVIALWATFASTAVGWRCRLITAGVTGLGPMLGFVVYSHPEVWPRFLETAISYQTSLTYGDLITEWLVATLRDFWYLAPLAILGFGVMVVRLWPSSARRSPGLRSQLLFFGAAALVPFLLLGLLGRTPWERNLVPLLPLWYGGWALLLAAAMEAISRHLARWRLLAGALCLLMLGLAYSRELNGAGYFQRHRDSDKPFGLYDQYCQQEFRPWATVQILRELAAKEPVVVFSDNSDLWSLIWCLNSMFHGDIGCRFVYYRSERLTSEVLTRIASGRRVILTACSAERAVEILRYLQSLNRAPLPAAVREIARTGFFKIYACEMAVSAPPA